MKKTYLILMAAAALAAAASCNKAAAPAANSAEPVLRPTGTLTVTIGQTSETKADLSAMKASQINSAQIFIFDESDKLETDVFKSFSPVQDGTTSITMNTLTGNKTVYAVINHSRMTFAPSSTTLAQFEGTLTDLSDMGASFNTNIVMSGKNTVNVAEYNSFGAGGSNSNVTVYVKRLVSRIQLDKITVNFSDNSLAGADFQVLDIYLKNVVGKSYIGVDGLTSAARSSVAPKAFDKYDSDANWYNKMTPQASGAPDCISDAGINRAAAGVSGEATTLNRVLYAFPNATDADSRATTWSPRHTRLVIKAHLTKASISLNEDTYYVLDLPAMQANWYYEIQNVTITMKGKPDDSTDEGLSVGKLVSSIVVDEWENVKQLNYEY